MTLVTCDRCGRESPPKVRGFGGAIAQGWRRFEAVREDGDSVHHVTVCLECLMEAEEANVWP